MTVAFEKKSTTPFASAGAKGIAFVAIACIWCALDQFSKSFFADMQPGGIIAGPFLGLFDIRLVYNTGGAWGIFSGNTWGLGVFSVIVCIVLTAYFIVTIRSISLAQTLGLALVVAGGAGNAIDRFLQGFVTDFIEFSFMDFPVFNVADIGVTCGFVIFMVAMLVEMRNEGENRA